MRRKVFRKSDNNNSTIGGNDTLNGGLIDDQNLDESSDEDEDSKLEGSL